MTRHFRQHASLVLNAGLAVTALALLQTGAKPARETSAPPSPGQTSRPIRSIEEEAAPRYTPTASAPDRRRWLVDRLREMGVPDDIMARVVMADIEAGWIKHAAEVAKKSHGDPDTMAALQLEIDRTRDDDMRAALGEAGFMRWDRNNMLREANQGRIPLSASELDASYALWKKLKNRELDLKGARVNATMDEADIGGGYELALSEFERGMKGLLGEERYARSRRLDDVSSAENMLQDLVQTNASDSQFGELLRTQHEWNELRLEIDRRFKSDPSSADHAEQLRALDEARDHEYRRVLGDEVYDAMQKEGHPGYSMMKKHAELWGLDERKIDHVYGSLKYYKKTVEEYQEQARALEARGESVDWAAINERLQEFTDQSRQALQTYLGRDSFDKMRRNGVFELTGNGLPRGAPLSPENRGNGS